MAWRDLHELRNDIRDMFSMLEGVPELTDAFLYSRTAESKEADRDRQRAKDRRRAQTPERKAAQARYSRAYRARAKARREALEAA